MSLFFDGDNGVVQTDGGSQAPLIFRTDGIDRVYITPQGDVGIGTTSPQGKLNVVGHLNVSQGIIQIFDDSPALEQLRFIGPTPNQSMSLYFDSQNGVVQTDPGSQAPLIFRTDGIDRVYLTPQGDVGIGTIGPSSRLEVAGMVTATGFIGDGSLLSGVNAASAASASFAANADTLDNLDSTQFARVDVGNLFAADQTIPNLFVGNVNSTGIVSAASVVASLGNFTDNLSAGSGTFAGSTAPYTAVLTATQTNASGVYFNPPMGILGQATAPSGFTIGVKGIAASPDGVGVKGEGGSNSRGVWGVGSNIGVMGEARVAVMGIGSEIGVHGYLYAGGGETYAVVGENDHASGATVGIQGEVLSPDGVAGRFRSLAGGKLISAVVNDRGSRRQDLDQEVFHVAANGNVFASGSVTAASFIGDGSLLSNVGAGSLGFDPATQAELDAETAARVSGDSSTLTSANQYTDSAVASEAAARALSDAALQSGLDAKVSKSGDTMSGDLTLPNLFASGGSFVGNTGTPIVEVTQSGAGNALKVNFSNVGGQALQVVSTGTSNHTSGIFVQTQTVSGNPRGVQVEVNASGSPHSVVAVEGSAGGPGTLFTLAGVQGSVAPGSGAVVRAGVRGNASALGDTAGLFHNSANGPILIGWGANDQEKFRVAGDGTVSAAKFVGDGSMLTGIGAGSLGFDPATQAELDAETAARVSGDSSTLSSANQYTDASVAAEMAARITGDAALQAGLDAKVSKSGDTMSGNLSVPSVLTPSIQSLPGDGNGIAIQANGGGAGVPNGGSLSLLAGAPSGGGTGGSVNIQGGEAPGGAGGSIAIAAGAGINSGGAGGTVSISGGVGNAGPGGSVNVTAGDAINAWAGGDVNLAAGGANGGDANGSVVIAGGSGAGRFNDAVGGNVIVRSGTGASTPGTIQFSIGNSEAARMDPSGNVGIGTAAPMAKLHVAGTVKATAFEGDGSLLTGISAGSLGFDTATQDELNAETAARVSGDTATLAAANQYTDASVAAEAAARMAGDAALAVSLDAKVSKSGDTMSGRLTISGDENQGLLIGNASSSREGQGRMLRLVQNSPGTNNGLYLSTEVGGQGTFFETHRANGTLSSKSALVSGDLILGVQPFGWDGATYREAARLAVQVGDGVGLNSMPGAWNFYTRPPNSTASMEDYLRMVITPQGDVGVGIGAPSAKLEVAGTVKATSFEGDGSLLSGIATQAGLDAHKSSGDHDSRYLLKAEKASDANLLDGLDSAQFARVDTTNAFAASQTFNGSITGTTALFDSAASGSLLRVLARSSGASDVLSVLTAGAGFGQSLAAFGNQTTGPGLRVRYGSSSTADMVLETAFRDLELRSARHVLVTGPGNVGIGTASPSAKLEVAGSVKIADGTQGAGKVLTSDANGLASWQAVTTTATDLSCAGCVNASDVAADVATQAELDTHKASGDHDSRYAQLATSNVFAGDVTAANLITGGNLTATGAVSGGSVAASTGSFTSNVSVSGNVTVGGGLNIPEGAIQDARIVGADLKDGSVGFPKLNFALVASSDAITIAAGTSVDILIEAIYDLGGGLYPIYFVSMNRNRGNETLGQELSYSLVTKVENDYWNLKTYLRLTNVGSQGGSFRYRVWRLQ